jgi:hypothetical protein
MSSLNNTVQSVVYTSARSSLTSTGTRYNRKKHYLQTVQDGGDTIALPITVADRSEGCLVFYSTNTGIMGSNPFRGTDICLCFFLCVRCPLYVEDL